MLMNELAQRSRIWLYVVGDERDRLIVNQAAAISGAIAVGVAIIDAIALTVGAIPGIAAVGLVIYAYLIALVVSYVVISRRS